MDKWIQIFKAGSWKDAKGRNYSFSNSDLDHIVAVNDPAARTDHRKVPLVIGHPKPSHPAFGVVGALKHENGVLFMKGADVVPEFAEAVNKGYYRKTSICVNPETHELEHVGFLGAVQPAVPGLADAQFSAPKDESVLLEFSAWSADGIAARLFQGIRDYLIEKEGLEKANTILDPWSINALQELGAADTATSDYSKGAGAAITPEAPAPSARELELEAENTRLKNAASAAAQAAREAENAAFCKGLVDNGQLAPADREETLAFLNAFTGPELASFSKEGEPDMGARFKTYLSKLKKQLHVGGEIATAGADLVDPGDGVTLGKLASAFMAEQESKGITITAIDAVNHILSQGAKR